MNYSKSYFNFVASQEKELQNKLNSSQVKLLELFSNEINNSKRVEENIILLELLKNEQSTLSEIKELITKNYGYIPSNETLLSAIRNINFMFVTNNTIKMPLNSSQKVYFCFLNLKKWNRPKS